MRSWILACGLLAACSVFTACSPVIATGDYLCGTEESCPEGQVCNGADNTCVIPASAEMFACDPAVETHEPDEDAAHAAALGTSRAHVSIPIVIEGCLANNDKDDWYSFATDAQCTSQQLTASLAAPIAFESLTLELFDATGATKLATAADNCTGVQSPDVSGEATLCISQMLAPGTSYTLHVTPTGQDTCGGSCAFNRYRLTAQTTLH